MEKSNIITLQVASPDKSERKLSVEASQPKIEKLAQPGRYYVTPALRVRVRIPSMLHVRVSPKAGGAGITPLRTRPLTHCVNSLQSIASLGSAIDRCQGAGGDGLIDHPIGL